MDVPTGLVLLAGENAQGKTNLLEALFLLATGHSHRSDVDREMIGWSASRDPIPHARVAAHVISHRGETNLEMIMQLARRSDQRGELPAPWSGDDDPGPTSLTGGTLQKAFKVNGVRQRTVSAPGVLAVVLAGPEEVDLIGGPPLRRRRFLDLANAQVDPLYAKALQRYQRVLTQRNALLRQVRERGGGPRPAEMDVWDRELVQSGAYILQQRRAMLEVLRAETASVYAFLAGQSISLALVYHSTIGPLADLSQRELPERFLAALRDSWPRDSATATTSVGPHRDDFRALTGDVDLGVYGSRGQQRTVALALVLGQAAYIRGRIDEEPLLLLDDPLSELDGPRRERLLEHCLRPESQVLITTAEPELVPQTARSQASIFRVEAGAVRPDGGG
jgi:DNA replication and repair protein RecF